MSSDVGLSGWKAAVLISLGAAVAVAFLLMMMLTGRSDDPLYPRNEDQLDKRLQDQQRAGDAPQNLNPDIPRPRRRH